MTGHYHEISAKYTGHSDGHFHFVKGFKSEISEWQPFVDKAALRGRLDTRLLGFKDPGNELKFIEDDRNAVGRFLLSATKGKPYVEKAILGAHSWGATRLLEFMSDDENAEFIADNYDGIVLAAPFAGSYFQRGMFYGPLARAYSYMVGNTPVGTTRLEKFVTSRFMPAAAVNFDTTPTHAQSLYVDGDAIKVLRNLRKRGGLPPILRRMPISVMIGTQDTVCKNSYIHSLANTLGVVPDEFDADHYLLLNNPDAQQFVVDFAEQITTERRMNLPLTRRRHYDGSGFHDNDGMDFPGNAAFA